MIIIWMLFFIWIFLSTIKETVPTNDTDHRRSLSSDDLGINWFEDESFRAKILNQNAQKNFDNYNPQNIEDTGVHTVTTLVDFENFFEQLILEQKFLVKATQDVSKFTKELSEGTIATQKAIDVYSTMTKEQEAIKAKLGVIGDNLKEFNTKLNALEKTKDTSISTSTQIEERVKALESKVSNLSYDVNKLDDTVPHLLGSDCPDKFEWIGDDCLYISFYDILRTWFDARRVCQDMGADLAVPTNLTALARRLKGETVPNLWVGATSSMNGGKWRWLITGNDIQNDIWAPGHPLPQSWFDCGYLSKHHNYQMMEVHCDVTYYYACQVFPKGYWRTG